MRIWNYRVHVWIRYYVQERLAGPGKRATGFQYGIIFLNSAIWHGFKPAYYNVFFNAAIGAMAHGDLIRAWRLFTWIPLPVRYFLGWFST